MRSAKELFSTPLLQIRGLSLRGLQNSVILRHLSLSVNAGEMVALVGESGSGKTMMARAVLRLLPQQVRTVRGEIVFDGQNLLALKEPEMRRIRGGSIGMTFQDPAVSLNPTMRIGDQLAEALRVSGQNVRARRIRMEEMLARVCISDPIASLRAYPHQFSEGARQRIMLASAMLRQPRLLIVDESTSALDSLTQLDIMKILSELRRDAGTAILLITHDLGLVSRYADTIFVLHRGCIVESGSAVDTLSTPQAPYTRALVDALSRQDRRPQLLRCTSPLLEGRAIEVAFSMGRWPARPVRKLAVDSVSLTVNPNETIALVGGSGSGKTTLGRALVGVQRLTAGSIVFRGIDMKGANPAQLRDYRLSCQFIYQDPYSSLDPRQRIGEIVAEPLRQSLKFKTGKRERVMQLLEEVALSGLQFRYPHELSAGQRQRVAIARALVGDPEFIVADEPLSNLDILTQRQLLELFKKLKARRKFACVFITHSLAAASELADRVMIMHGGRIVEHGNTYDTFKNPRHDYTKRLVEASFDQAVRLSTNPKMAGIAREANAKCASIMTTVTVKERP